MVKAKKAHFPARKKAAVKTKARHVLKRSAARIRQLKARRSRPAARTRPAPKAELARKDKYIVAKPLPKLLPKAKTGEPQKLDKATLRKALLRERLARAKAEGKPRSTGRLTAKEKSLVKEFERKEFSPAEVEARRTRLKNLIVLGKERSYL